jgi:hypothetical protein
MCSVEPVQPLQDRLDRLHRGQLLGRDGTGQGGRVHLADLVGRRHRLRLLAVLLSSDRTNTPPNHSQTPVRGLDKGTMEMRTTSTTAPSPACSLIASKLHERIYTPHGRTTVPWLSESLAQAP